MSYKVTATEKTTGSGNRNEVKALLFLLSQHRESERMVFFVIDVFNDVTATDSHARSLWDVQSKGAKAGPADIGKGLVTLFKNYTSEFNQYFADMILFLGGVTGSVRRDEEMSVFRFDHMKPNAQKRVRDELKLEAGNKSYVSEEFVTDQNIESFLQAVTFVVANPEPARCVEPLVGIASPKLVNDAKLRTIFNELKNVQSAKKDIIVEGAELSHPDEALNMGKHLTRRGIEKLILNRLLDINPFDPQIPESFVRVYATFPDESASSVLEDCRDELALQLFDKNSKESFWALFGEIVDLIEERPEHEVEQIYRAIKPGVRDACTHLTKLSTQYFIACIKEGVK